MTLLNPQSSALHDNLWNSWEFDILLNQWTWSLWVWEMKSTFMFPSYGAEAVLAPSVFFSIMMLICRDHPSLSLLGYPLIDWAQSGRSFGFLHVLRAPQFSLPPYLRDTIFHKEIRLSTVVALCGPVLWGGIHLAWIFLEALELCRLPQFISVSLCLN